LSETDFFNESIESLLYEKFSGWRVLSDENGSQLNLDEKQGDVNSILEYLQGYMADLTKVG